jgi:hypothetical protein
MGSENIFFREVCSTLRIDINLFELQTAKPDIFYIVFDIVWLAVYEFRTPLQAAYTDGYVMPERVSSVVSQIII